MSHNLFQIERQITMKLLLIKNTYVQILHKGCLDQEAIMANSRSG